MDLLLLASDAAYALSAGVVHAADPVPEPEDVRAGWTAFWIFMALIAAVVLLLWSFVRQLRKTRRNADRGVFDPSDPRRRRSSFVGPGPHDPDQGPAPGR